MPAPADIIWWISDGSRIGRDSPPVLCVSRILWHTGLSHKGFWSVLPLAGQHLLSTLAVRLDLVEPGRFKFRPYAASSIPVRIEDPPEHRRLGSRMARALLRFSATRAL